MTKWSLVLVLGLIGWERERGVSFIHQSQSKDKQKNKQSQIIFDIQLKIALTARLVIGHKAQTDV